MTEIVAIKHGNVYEVTIGGIEEYSVSSKRIEEIAREWNVEAEMVAQLRVIEKIAEEEDGNKKMTYQEFFEGYEEILRVKPIEELVYYCLDTQAYYLVRPKKLLEKILEEENYKQYFDI